MVPSMVDQHTSVVFDYYPRGEPVIINDAMEEAMHAVLDETGETKQGSDLATEALRDEGIRQLEKDPSLGDALREAYEASTVNLVSPTVGRGPLNNPVKHGDRVRTQLARWQARFDTLDWLHKATSPGQAREIVDGGGVGIVLNVQNIGVEVYDNLSELEVLNNFGVQIMQLTYNCQNLIASSSNERIDGGISTHGLDVVETLNDLGVIIDVSHLGTESIHDAAEHSRAPIAGTHMPQNDYDYEEESIDEKISAIAASDGYVGLTILPAFVAPHDQENAFEVFFDRLDHVVSVVGADHVGIGTDWGRWTVAQPPRLQRATQDKYDKASYDVTIEAGLGFGPMETYADWPAIPEELDNRGYSEEEIEKIAGENFMAFWDRVSDHAA